jgi:3D (Asp-Asp-Asp) domain-containing protein
MLVVLCVRIVDGSFSSEPEAVDLDGQVWREWLTDVGVDGGAYQPPLWASNTAPPAADEEVAPIGGSPDAARFFRVDVTGYCSRVEETDADPFLTAMCTVTGSGVIALSRDLLRTFTPGAPFDFGDKVLLPGAGVFSVEDTMHPRWQRRADIWFPNIDEAHAWGRRVGFLARVDGTTPLFPPDPDVAQLMESME